MEPTQKKLLQAILLKHLHNEAMPLGLGSLHVRGPLTTKEAESMVAESTYFDYVYGRPLKVNLGSVGLFPDGKINGVDGRLYVRDQGDFALARALNKAAEEYAEAVKT